MARLKSIALSVSVKRALRSIVAGAFLSVPFWWVESGWFVVPAVTLYLLWLDRDRPTIWRIWLSGASFFSIILSWMYHIHATELIPNNVLAFAFLTLTFAVVVAALSSGFLLFGWLWKQLAIKVEQQRSLWLIPAVWALAEFARSVVFSIVSSGPGWSLGAHWNFGSLAFPASVTPLGYAGRLFGQFGLSALVVTMAWGLLMLTRKRWHWGILALAVPVLAALVGFAWSTAPQGKSLQVGMVQLDDSSYSDYGYQKDLGTIARRHQARNSLDLLVLPEYSYIFEEPKYEQATVRATQQLFGAHDGRIVTSRSGTAENGHDNLVTFYTAEGKVVAQQKKQFLIPAGEYIPYFYEWILVLSGNTSVIRAHQAEHAVSKAPQPARPVAYGREQIGSLACSGAIAPEFYRHLVASGATVLTNSAALSTMGLSSSYYTQARQMAAFLAVANARPLVQAARGAQAFAIDSNGHSVVERDQAGVAYLEATITANSQKMPYSRLGEWYLVAAAVMVGSGLLKKVSIKVLTQQASYANMASIFTESVD